MLETRFLVENLDKKVRETTIGLFSDFRTVCASNLDLKSYRISRSVILTSDFVTIRYAAYHMQPSFGGRILKIGKPSKVYQGSKCIN